METQSAQPQGQSQSVTITLRELLEAGAHFGHPKNRWDPRMKPYIFGQRGGVYIVDLQKTVVLCQEAMDFLRDAAAQGKIVMFVGTKRQAQDIIAREAERCEMFFVHHRWLGGLLTNWQTVKKSIDKLKELDNLETDQRFAHLTKKERLSLSKRREQLSRVLGGIKEMGRRPDIVFIVDTHREDIAVAEANTLGIPIVGLVDTNANPHKIDMPIPANDDAIRAIELFTTKAADAVIEGRNQWRASRPERTQRTGRRRRTEEKPAARVVTAPAEAKSADEAPPASDASPAGDAETPKSE